MGFWSSVGSSISALSEKLEHKEIKHKPEDAGFKNFARDVKALQSFDINAGDRAQKQKKNIAKEQK